MKLKLLASVAAAGLFAAGAASAEPNGWYGAIDAGYRIGRHVRLGRVPGSVIGYNISNFGRFSGASYPLLVETEYGVTKCSMREVSPA